MRPAKERGQSRGAAWLDGHAQYLPAECLCQGDGAVWHQRDMVHMGAGDAEHQLTRVARAQRIGCHRLDIDIHRTACMKRRVKRA